MHFLVDLWQPILLSAALVFIASAIAWTVLPFHNREWRGLPAADAVREAIKAAGWQPGRYMFPFSGDPANRRSPEFMAKFAEGPSGMVTLMPPGPMQMGKTMTLSFLFNVLVSVLVAYVTHHAFEGQAAPSYLKVFQISGATAFIAYAMGTMPESIWFSRPWTSWFLNAADSLVFALLVGGSFGALWR